jgi:endonuclease YncB( thermonuclease family)
VRQAALSTVLFLLALNLATHAQTITGKVVGIHDGDTLTVLDTNRTQHQIRLNGVDAPELGQPFGQASKRNLSELIFGKTVNVETNKTDRYGRLVGLITFDGKDINLEQLRAGLAWYYKQYERDVAPDRRQNYADTERAARAAKRGLWADPAPVAPWDYRHPNPAEVIAETGGKIVGNKNSLIYHLPNCPDYGKVSDRNRVLFDSEKEAEGQGYRKAKNCSK